MQRDDKQTRPNDRARSSTSLLFMLLFNGRKLRGDNMQKQIFEAMLNAEDGDYVFQALVLSAANPEGW